MPLSTKATLTVMPVSAVKASSEGLDQFGLAVGIDVHLLCERRQGGCQAGKGEQGRRFIS
jgi:hypothetical protein